MGQPLKAILEKDGRLRLVRPGEINTDAIERGESFTIQIVGIADDDDDEIMGYTLLSEEALEEFWEDEPDIEEVWEVS